MGKIKRIFKIIVIRLLSLFVISAVGIFIFLKTFNVSRFKPQIIAAAQNALSRSVNFGDIALKISLRRGIQLRFTDIAIGEHPAFEKENFLTAQEANLSISIKDLILKRQIRILGVEAQSPQIKIIRLKDGRINVQSFGMATAVKQQTGEDIQQKSYGKPAPSAAMGLPAIFINRIAINNAHLEYIDYSFEPKISLVFDQMLFKAENFSLNKPFPITLRAAFATDSQNIFAKGSGEVNMSRLSFLLKDVTATAPLSTLSMDRLRRFIPQLEEVPLPQAQSGELSVSIELLEAGPQGLIALKGQGTLSKGSLRMKELVVPIESIQGNFSMSESAITLNNLSLSLGKARADLSGTLDDYMLKQNYSVKLKASGIELTECINQAAFPIKMKGEVSAELALNGQGFDPNTFLSKLNGNGALEIKEGSLTDINILKMVLDRLSFVPNLAGVLEASLPDRFKEKLRQKDTIITALKANIGISNGSIIIQPMNMEADGFLFQGSGTIGFDQSYAFSGSFIIPQDLSAKIVGIVSEMEFLLDETKQIRFPLKVSGKGASVSFFPDVKQMGITAIKYKGHQELEKVLDKVFDRAPKDGSKQPSADTEPTDDTLPGATQEKSKKQQLIEGVIDTIFKQ